MVKVSVVVPVYNVEKYLAEGIESIRRQTLEDIEIILVNDGSTDRSMSICKQQEELDGRIRVIDKLNGGVSSARNAGLEAASGEFVGFIDPDDWAEPEMFERMYNRAEEIDADACICNYVRNEAGRVAPVALELKRDLLNKDEVVGELIAGAIASPDLNSGASAIMGSVWRCLYRRELVENNDLRFIEGIPFMEDTLFCIQAFSKCNRIAVDEGFYYNYRIIAQSATGSYKKYAIANQKLVYGLLESIIREEKLEDFLRSRLDLRLVNMDFDLISNEVHRNNPKTFKEKIRTISDICSDKKLKRILSELDTSGYTMRKRFILNSMKKGYAVLIYIYYIFISRLL
jgi:glycosyltransferase EpsH